MGLGPKVFTRKNGTQRGGGLYKWSPNTSDKKNKDKVADSRASLKPNYFCVSGLNTQGNDFKTTYSYVVVVINGQSERYAYVQCDYVA